MALGQAFFRVLGLSSLSIIPSVLHIHVYLYVPVIKMTNKRSLGISQQLEKFNRKILTLLFSLLKVKYSACLSIFWFCGHRVSVFRLFNPLPFGSYPHVYDIFVNCNWVVTRWQ
jgi:hypothetical protein